MKTLLFVCVLIVCHQQSTCSMLTIHLLNWCLINTWSTFLHSIMLTEEASEVRPVFLALQLTFPVNFWGLCASAAMEWGQKPFTTEQGAAALTPRACPENNTQPVQSIIIQLHIHPARRLIICFPCFTVEWAEAHRDGESWRRTGNKCQSSLVLSCFSKHQCNLFYKPPNNLPPIPRTLPIRFHLLKQYSKKIKTVFICW